MLIPPTAFASPQNLDAASLATIIAEGQNKLPNLPRNSEAPSEFKVKILVNDSNITDHVDGNINARDAAAKQENGEYHEHDGGNEYFT